MVQKRPDDSIILLPGKPPEESHTIVLGITGGIACGKSLICRLFKEFGATVVSADELSREAVRPGTKAFAAIVAHFGKEILTPEGEIDRARLASRIFQTPTEREELNRITHPAIARLAERRLNELRTKQHVPLIIYEAPLLFEAKAEGRVDLVLVVAATPENQLERLMRRDNLSREEALQRISAQMPLAEKISRCDILVQNNGAPEEIKEEVRHIYAKLAACDKKNPPGPGDGQSHSP